MSEEVPEAARRGLRLLDEGRWFEAHEELERAWLEEAGERRLLWKALLQLGVAWLHLERGNPRGARSLVRRGRSHLAPFLPRRAGLDLAAVDALAARFERWLDGGGGAPGRELPDELVLKVRALGEGRDDRS